VAGVVVTPGAGSFERCQGKDADMSDKKRMVIGFDLGGTKMLAGLIDGKFNVAARDKKRTRGKDGDDDVFGRMVKLIEDLLAENGLTADDIAGIGIGSPGPLDPVKGVIGNTPNLGWNNFPLGDKMRKAFGVPVAVGNDVDMGTYGEAHFGAARKGRHVLGVFPGTGIGGGLVIDGKVHMGASGAAAEIGHVVIDPAGPRCGCGRRGCLEAYASRWAIASRAWVHVIRGEAPALAGDAGTDPANYRSKALARAIAAGDSLVEEVVRDAAARIGQVVGSLVNMISPDTVVLGGGLVEAMPDIFVDEVKRLVKTVALPELEKCVRIVPAKLGDDAVMMGAAKLIADKLEGDE